MRIRDILIALVCGPFIAWYLLGAFVAADLNFVHWDSVGRFVLAFFMLVSWVLVGISADHFKWLKVPPVTKGQIVMRPVTNESRGKVSEWVGRGELALNPRPIVNGKIVDVGCWVIQKLDGTFIAVTDEQATAALKGLYDDQ